MSKEKMGLLVMAYGAPYNEGDIERFYTHISGGRKPSKEAVSALTKKYGTIGGISPLAEITKKQANALRDKLNERQGQLEFSLYIGLKHIEPYIEDAVVQMKKDGIKEAVSIVLTPHYSKYGVNTYIARAVGKAKEIGGLTIHAIKQWHNEPGFIDYWVNEIKKIYEKMSNEDKEGTMLIMSAHSLPKHFVQNDDPYVDQLQETAKLISAKAGIKNYKIGWQSGRNAPEAWLKPDILSLTRDLHKKAGYKTFVYAPVGFVADHLEILYDNDYECRLVCDELGVGYHRPKMPNAAPQFIEMLATVCLGCLKSQH